MCRASDLAIRTRRLRKVFSGKVAVRNLTLDVSRGEVFGFLGPNGAGKSTSIKMLLGLVFPTSGEAEILGRPAGDVKTRSKVGFLPEHFRFYDWLTSTELLKLHGRLYGMSHGMLRERVPALLDLVLMWMESLVLLSVTFAFATYFSTLTSGVLALGLHGLAFLGGWIEQFGALTQTQPAVSVGVVASVLMPSEALWRRAAFEMQSPLANAMRISPFSTLSVPSKAMVFYAALYLAIALVVAIRRFSQRDL
jgi:energy-coupling factor transporter ATP-binding protein EcfA2